MASRKIEETLDRLSELRSEQAAEAVPELRKALAGRVGVVIAKAAKVAAELQARELIPELAAAFERLCESPVERDPQCLGKIAVAKALTELDYRQAAPFLRGAGFIQMEPTWGGQEDTASNLRGICLLGLASCPDAARESVMRCLVDGLTDKKANVRVEAVRALGQMGGDDSALVLRLKARMGDDELPVVGQVFDGILALEREEAVPFVGEFLRSEREYVPEEAALALGASRMPGALDALERVWESTRDPDLRQAVLRGMSASRETRAIQFLIGLLKDGRPREAEAAMEALAIHKGTPEIRRMVEQVVRELGGALQQAFRQSFSASNG